MPKYFPDYSALAQLVEQLTVNQRVAGSSPAGGAISSKLDLVGGLELIEHLEFWLEIVGLNCLKNKV